MNNMMSMGLTSFAISQIFFIIMFVIVFVIIISVMIKGLKQWKNNNNSPKLTVPATVVSKRMSVSHHHHSSTSHMDTHTNYYVTFEVDSGDRMELWVPSTEYGLLVEGDKGELSFQGTRYLNFSRKYNTGFYSSDTDSDSNYRGPEL